MRPISLGLRIVLALACLIAAPACGGGSGGDGAPTLTVDFPPPFSVTTAETLTLRGRTTSSEPVAGVRVGGVEATSSDGFKTWEATAPLSSGENAISVGLTLPDGNELLDLTTISVRRDGVTLPSPGTVDRDPATGALYVYDRYEGVSRLDPATSTWSIVSPNAEGDTSRVSQSAYDVATIAYYLLDDGTLTRVDPITGVRTPVTGSGPTLGSSYEFLDGGGNGKVYAASSSTVPANTILCIDLTTGTRSHASSNSIGTGPALGTPVGLYVADGGDDAYVLTNNPRQLLHVDLSTGNRTLLMDDDSVAGNLQTISDDLVVDAAADRAYSLTRSGVTILNFAAGTQTALIVPPGPDGDDLKVPTCMVSGAAGELVITDTSSGGFGHAGLSRVDIATGVLTNIAVAPRGTGHTSSGIEELVVDPENNQLLAIDGHGNLLGIDLSNGDRTVISGPEVGTGPLADNGYDSLTMGPPGTAYAGAFRTIHSINLANGARTLVAGPLLGTGPEIEASRGLGWDAAQDELHSGTPGSGLVHIDPASGNRATTIVDTFYELYDVDVVEGGLVLATESSGDGYVIRTVDLSTGQVSALLFVDDALIDGLSSVETLSTDSVTGAIFAQGGRSGIFEIDPLTGDPRDLGDPGDPTLGSVAGSLNHLTIDPRNGVIYASGSGILLAIDPLTGERVTVAR